MLKSLFKKLDRYHEVFSKKDGKVMQKRWSIFLKEKIDFLKKFPFNVFIHQFYQDDVDDFHDHPWNYRVIVLKGGYWEHFADGSKVWRAPWSYRKGEALKLHKITLARDDKGNIIPATTIFITGKLFREWGYIQNGKWVIWTSYDSIYSYDEGFNDRGITELEALSARQEGIDRHDKFLKDRTSYRSKFVYDLDLSYDNDKLKEEIKDLNLEPYFKDNPNTDSWFAGPESWLYADIPDKPNTEIDRVRKQLKELLGTNDVVFAVMKQKAGTSVPAHHDKISQKILDQYPGTKAVKCSVNIQLNEPIGMLNFSRYGGVSYKCAILNVMEKHGVPSFSHDRLFIKFKILDMSYQEAVSNYEKNKNGVNIDPSSLIIHSEK